MHAAIVLLLLVPALAQPRSDAYAGTWTADWHGKTFVRLELRMSAGALVGQISLGNIHVDATGRVNHAEEAPVARTPIADVIVKDSALAFTHKDGDDTDRFELRLIDAASAELRFLPNDADRQELAGQGIPEIKPIPLKRVAR